MLGLMHLVLRPIRDGLKAAFPRMFSSNNAERKLSIMLTDPGNLIPDDEMLLQVIMSTSRDTDWLVVCVPGDASLDPEDSIKESIKRQQTLCDLFPDKFDRLWSTWTSLDTRNSAPDNQLNSTYTIGDISLLQSVTRNIEYLIHIAPLWHIPPEKYLEHLTADMLIVMGDLENPEQSTNLLKSLVHHPWIECDKEKDEIWTKQLTEQYHQQLQTLHSISKKTVCIPSSFARNVRIPYQFFLKLPESLSEPVVKMSFQQLVKRPEPTSPRVEEISKADHSRILSSVTDTVQADIIDNDGVNTIPMEIRQQTTELVTRFLVANKDASPELHKRYCDIAMAVYAITQTPYISADSSEEAIFSVENLADPVTAEENWRAYIAKYECDLVPSYDVLVWVVMQYGYLPQADVCREALLLDNVPYFL